MTQMRSSSKAGNLAKLLKPASVAVIGASEDANKPGSRALLYSKKYEYSGRLYAVNPKYKDLFGFPCFPSIAELPEVPDLVVISLPAQYVVGAVKSCCDRGVPAVIIFSSGFAETKTDFGIAEESRLKGLAETYDTVICGPNCQGTANFFQGMIANFSSALAAKIVTPGSISVVSQSGLFAALIADACQAIDCGVGYVGTTGNEVDVQFSDLVEVMAHDPAVDVIVGYLEGLRNVDRFRRAANVARDKGKPIVLLKVGKSERAAEAAASHTGALAGSSVLYDALFEELGVFAVSDLGELIDAAYLFSLKPKMAKGKAVGLLTNSGGLGVLCTDLVDKSGLHMADLTSDTVENLTKGLPEFGSAQNPVDFTTQATTDIAAVGRHIENVAFDENVDIVVLCLGFLKTNAEELCKTIASASDASGKPIVVAWISSDDKCKRQLIAAGVPVFDSPEGAISGARDIQRLSEFRKMVTRPGLVEPTPAIHALSAAIRSANVNRHGLISEFDATGMLEKAGLPVPATARVADIKAIDAAFAKCGPKVVMKVDSKDIAHKTDVGGVLLPILGLEQAKAGFDQIMTNVTTNAPTADISGVILCKMIEDGLEVIVGAKRDPVLGPFVMVGLGGVFAEVFEDVAFHSAPFDEEVARQMIQKLKAFPMLNGARGKQVRDVAALARILARLSQIINEIEEIEELDLNPVLVMENDSGAFIADALIRRSMPV